MQTPLDQGAQGRLEKYLGGIGEILAHDSRRASFATYALGLLSEGERKSIEPIAARSCADDEQVSAVHQQLQHFITDSPWSDREVRRGAARYAIEALSAREPVETWQIDDTGFLKQGTHSVGVQRQYTGSAGKITNCQLGVSLAVATSSEQIPVDFELYLPVSWIEDPGRRREARVPDEMTFKTKVQLALEMIERAARNGIPGSILLADSAYGDSTDFRNALRKLGLDFAVGVLPTLGVVRLDRLDRINAKRESVAELVEALSKKAFRRLVWRDGTRRKMRSRFCFVRVKTTHDDGIALADREPLWLVAEWPEGESKPTKFLLTTLPRRMSHKEIVRIL